VDRTSRSPNKVLRRIREEERQETREEFAESIASQALMLGENISCNYRTIARWEDGDTTNPYPAYRRVLSALLGRPFSELGFSKKASDDGCEIGGTAPASKGKDSPLSGASPVDALRQATVNDFSDAEHGKPVFDSSVVIAADVLANWGDPACSAQPQVLILSSMQIGMDEIEQLESMVVTFRTWNHQYGGGMRRKAAIGQLNELAELLGESYPRPIRRRLLSLTARLAIITGHMFGDSAGAEAAYNYLVLALQIARESGDETLGARAANALARQLLIAGNQDAALALLGHAYDSFGSLSAEDRALLLASKAWAYAHLGSYDSMATSLDQATQLLEDNPASTLFGPAEISGVSGACFETLALVGGERKKSYAQKAEQHILAALKLREPLYARSRVLDLVGLANVQLSQGEPDGAIETGRLALGQAIKLRSPRTNRRIHALAVRALDEFPGAQQVSEFAESVRTQLAAI
jgi:tetratricopeptide (TPR) repeat protein